MTLFWKKSKLLPTCWNQKNTYKFCPGRGDKVTKNSSSQSEDNQLQAARDWEMLEDVGQWLVFPTEISVKTLISDIVLWSPGLLEESLSYRTHWPLGELSG